MEAPPKENAVSTAVILDFYCFIFARPELFELTCVDSASAPWGGPVRCCPTPLPRSETGRGSGGKRSGDERGKAVAT